MMGLPVFSGYFRRGYVTLAWAVTVLAAALPAWSTPPLQETDVLVAVKCGQPPAGLAVAPPVAREMQVRVRGPQERLNALATASLPAYSQPLEGLGAGVHSLTVEKKRIVLPAGITVVAVKPPTLVINLENRVYKKVPVVISLKGRPAAGFTVGDAVPDPPMVTLQGPRTVLVSLTRVFTRPVDVSGTADSFSREISLDLPETVEPFESSGVVVARISVVGKIVTLVLEKVAVGARGSRLSWRITPTAVNLQIRGPESVLEALRSDMGSRVYLDLAGLEPGVYVRRAVIDLPPDVQLISAEPGLFTVTLRER
jgi:YbbR domain-containing protein